MNWRERDSIIKAMCEGKPLYIKNTGVKISVDYFGSDLGEDRWSTRKKKHISRPVKVEFETAPSLKALKMCRKYHIKKNSHSKTMELDAEIELDNLSLSPYENRAAKLLYEKKK